MPRTTKIYLNQYSHNPDRSIKIVTNQVVKSLSFIHTEDRQQLVQQNEFFSCLFSLCHVWFNGLINWDDYWIFLLRQNVYVVHGFQMSVHNVVWHYM